VKNPRLSAARQYLDLRVLLAKEQLDLVAVCNPNGPRADAIMAAIERKLPVIAEKPLALSRIDLARIARQVEMGAKVGTLHPMRFDPPYRALRRLVETGELGEIVNVSAQKSYRWKNQAEWKRHRSTYGDTISWIGIHMIDLILFTTRRDVKEVFSWQARVSPQPDLGEMENTTGTVFRLDNGGIATLHMDYCRPDTAPTHGDDRLRIAGTKGVAEYTEATGVTLLSGARRPEVVRELPAEGSVFADFVEHVFNGTPTALPWTEIYRANLITIAAREAASSGRVVKV
jgi:predicted dehydrogenase